MNEKLTARLEKDALEWKSRTHIGRSQEEKQAYLEGIESALLCADVPMRLIILEHIEGILYGDNRPVDYSVK